MDEIGRVLAVVDEKRVLITSTDSLINEQQVTVFERTPFEGPDIGIDHVDFPKGKLTIIAPQGNGIYLAERFRQGTTSRKRISRPTGLAGLFGEDVYEDVPGPWSATLAKDEALNLKLNPFVAAGDLIARG